MRFFPPLNCLLIHILFYSIFHGVVCSSCTQTGDTRICNVLYVSDSRGTDSQQCGNISQPCKSFSMVIRQAFQQNNSAVCLNISAGIYKAKETLKMDCTSSHVQRLLFLGERIKQQQVYTGVSLEITTCEVTFLQINFCSPDPVLIKTLLSHISLCSCSMKDTKFSIIGQASVLELMNSEMSNCSGWKSGLPVLSVTSFPLHSGMLQILSCTFSHNNGTVLFTRDITQVSVLQSTFEGNMIAADQTIMAVGAEIFTLQGSVFINNFGSLLTHLDATSMNVSTCTFSNNLISVESLFLLGGMSNIEIKSSSFVENWGKASGLVIAVLGKGSNVSLKNCEFKCNSLNRQMFVPPIQTNNYSPLVCNNCSVDLKCPVHCPGGTHLTNALMCEPCDKGTFSLGSVGNSTPSECSKCLPGYFSSEKRSHKCRPCEEGTVSKSGSSSCVKCSNDFFTSARGESSCSRMKVGVIVFTVFVCFLIAAPLIIMTVQHWEKQPRRNGSGTCSTQRRPLCDFMDDGEWKGSIQS